MLKCNTKIIFRNKFFRENSHFWNIDRTVKSTCPETQNHLEAPQNRIRSFCYVSKLPILISACFIYLLFTFYGLINQNLYSSRIPNSFKNR